MSLAPEACDGSMMTGRWLSCFTTGTELMSRVLAVRVSKVRIPCSPRTTFVLPSLRMYSAAMSHSSIVAEGPRLRSTGRSLRPTARSKTKSCML